MNTHDIDEAIHKYVDERMEKGKKRAEERFLAYAYMRIDRSELAEFMKRVVGISRYYMDFFRVLRNPFKGPELAWFLSLLVIGICGCMLVADDESRYLGIVTLSGVAVNTFTLVAGIMKKWCNLAVLIAIYRELVEIAESEAPA